MIAEAIQYLHELPAVEEIETREIRCAGRCGARLEINANDDGSGLEAAGWVQTEYGYFCGLCEAPLSYSESADERIDYECTF